MRLTVYKSIQLGWVPSVHILLIRLLKVVAASKIKSEFLLKPRFYLYRCDHL